MRDTCAFSRDLRPGWGIPLRKGCKAGSALLQRCPSCLPSSGGLPLAGSSNCEAGSPGHLENGSHSSACSWRRACTGADSACASPTVNTMPLFPWTKPEIKAKGSGPGGQPGPARAMWGPQADVCSCLFSTWTCEALGWVKSGPGNRGRSQLHSSHMLVK